MPAVSLGWTFGQGVLLPGSGAGRCPGFITAAGPAKCYPPAQISADLESSAGVKKSLCTPHGMGGELKQKDFARVLAWPKLGLGL